MKNINWETHVHVWENLPDIDENAFICFECGTTKLEVLPKR